MFLPHVSLQDYITIICILFVQCEWEGVKCDPDDLIEIVADMGICYAFNAGMNHNFDCKTHVYNV